MFNFNTFGQKSPQQRFLFILGLFMITLFIALAILIVFFGDAINLDPIKFPQSYRMAFGVVLIIYALIRFFRITKDDN